MGARRNRSKIAFTIVARALNSGQRVERGRPQSGPSGGRQAMEFGHFTLSDNHYETNTRSANQFVSDILDEALHAEHVGFHSAWIGEHHLHSLGVLSCPDLVLANLAARTKRIRLAPAVTVLPLHHPIRVAEQWATLDLLSNGRVDFAAGRGYDRREYQPFKVDFDDNQGIFEEGMELVRALWSAGGERISHHGKHYHFDDVRITPQPVQKPIPSYVASFSKPSIELAARLGCGVVVAPFAAARTFGGLQRVAEPIAATAISPYSTASDQRVGPVYGCW